VIATAREALRARPLPAGYAAALLVLMSPLSRSGHIAESSAVTWLMVLALAVACWRAGFVRGRTLPRSIVVAQMTLLTVVGLYAIVGLSRGYGVRLVAWEANPFLEFAAFLLLARVIVRSRQDAQLVLVFLLAGAAVKGVADAGVFGWNVAHSPYTFLTAGLANRIIDVAPFLLTPVALFLAVGWGVGRRARVALVATSLVLTAVLIASLTRSFWIGLVAGVFAGVAVERGPTARRMLTVALITGCVVGAAYAVSPRGLVGAPGRVIKERFYDYTRKQIHSHDLTLATRRQDELRQAWRSARYDDFLGRGVGGTVPRTFAPLTTTEGPRIAFLHNYYAQILVKMGIAGLAAFLWLIGAAVYELGRAARIRRQFDGAVVAGVLAAWVMEGFQLLLYPKTNIFHVGAFMAALLGLVFFATENGGGAAGEELR
jgi:O-antigen ligase